MDIDDIPVNSKWVKNKLQYVMVPREYPTYRLSEICGISSTNNLGIGWHSWVSSNSKIEKLGTSKIW